ncbi:MAG: hypothetical protein EOO66_03295, partial [Methylobacterium sp.]
IPSYLPWACRISNWSWRLKTITGLGKWRAQGKYEGMREKIMVRDEAIAGSRNPMLQRHGEASEARQYSGRAVDSDWRCPFHYKGAE